MKPTFRLYANSEGEGQGQLVYLHSLKRAFAVQLAKHVDTVKVYNPKFWDKQS